MKMDQISKNQERERTDYIEIFEHSNPQTLTLLKKPQIIYEQMFKQATYIWIQKQFTKTPLEQKQIQQKLQIEVKFVEKALNVKQVNVPKSTNLILISHISTIKSLRLGLAPMIKKSKISCIIFYGVDNHYKKTINFKTNTQYAETQQKLLSILIREQKKYAKPVISNFIPLKHPNVKILMKTISGMLNQPSSKLIIQKIMQRFKQLAFLIYEESQIQQIEQFVDRYLEKGYFYEREAILQYTKNTFLHSFINSILRASEDPTRLYIIQPYFKDLFNSISKIHKEQKNIKKQKIICYRGTQLSAQQIDYFKNNIQSYVFNLGFMSTSIQEYQAKTFATNAIIQIRVDELEGEQQDQVINGYADLRQFTYLHSGEEEILFNFMNCFQIIDYEHYQEEYRDISQIVLKYVSFKKLSTIQGFKLSQNQQQIHKIRQQLSSAKKLADILVPSYFQSQQKGYNLAGSQEYCQKFFQIAQSSSKQSLINAHLLKFNLAKNNGDRKQMLEHYYKCLQLFEQFIKSQELNQKKVSQLNQKLQKLSQYIRSGS